MQPRRLPLVCPGHDRLSGRMPGPLLGPWLSLWLLLALVPAELKAQQPDSGAAAVQGSGNQKATEPQTGPQARGGGTAGDQDAGGGATEAPDTVRLLPKPAGIQEQIDAVFGEVIAAVAYAPFYNIAPTLGFSEEPAQRVDESGQRVPDSFLLRSAGNPVGSLAFTADSQHLLTVDADRRVVVWTVQGPNIRQPADAEEPRFAKPRVLRDLGIQPAEVTAVAANPALGPGVNGEVAVGLANGAVRVFRISKPEGDQDPATAWRVFDLPPAASPITLLAWSPDGAQFASGSRGGVLRLHDAMGQVTQEFADFRGGVAQVAFGGAADEDGSLYLAGRDNEGGLQLLRTSGSTVRPVPASEGRFSRLWALPGDYGYGLLDAEGYLCIYAADDSGDQLSRKPVADAGEPVQLGWSEEDGFLRIETLAASGRRFALKLRPDGSQELPPEQPEPLAGLTDPLLPLQVSSLSTYLGEDGENQRVELRYAGSDDTAYALVVGDSRWNLAALSPDGTRVAVAYGDGTVRLWEWLVRDPGGNLVTINIPIVVLWLVIGALVFTLMFRFVNVRMFRHALAVVSGRFTDPSDEGEVSHFQALASALSATVGLGNIAGVAIAISIGGPGATFWMIVAGLLGMSLKFTECTLGQRFRKIDELGQVSGGPMHYLSDGMKQMGLGFLGAPLAAIFTVFCIGGSLAGGNAFQVNQSLGILQGQVPFFEQHPYVYGVIMAVLAGIVIIGGIRRIASTAEKIVPTMCGVYVVSALAILVTNITKVPAAFGEIVGSALSGDAIYGGALGALITGFRRAAFSNEAGVGSAAIAHSAAKTPYAVREGIVALLEPFIDTVLVCTMTALVIVITGVYQDPAHSELVVGADGAALTAEAFASVPAFASWFPWVLMTAVILFAFSTMISWSYYGERCWTKVFGQKSSLVYKLVFLAFVVLGSVVTARNVLEFGDLMILLMAFPNIAGLYFLSRYVRRDLREYEEKLGTGQIRPVPK